MTDALADDLLDALRPVIGVDELGYVEAPIKLTGGFFTENHAFRLAGAPPSWDGPLVLRLFPSLMRIENVRCEVEVQRAVRAQHYPAPRVLTFDEQSRLRGRLFLVMERLPGSSMMGDVDFGTVIRRGPRLLTDLPRTMAEQQAALHALDPGPVVAALDTPTVTVERWFDSLRGRIDAGAVGFADALRWLVDNRPDDRGRRVICHGDLWPGNVLVDGREVTGVLDWTVATVAEPALDVGFSTMALSLVPIDAPRPVQRLVARLGRHIARRYVQIYQQTAPIDLAAQPYYEALRCATELSGVADYRSGEPGTASRDRPAPTWDSVADRMVEYFRLRTGVSIKLPAPAA